MLLGIKVELLFVSLRLYSCCYGLFVVVVVRRRRRRPLFYYYCHLFLVGVSEVDAY